MLANLIVVAAHDARDQIVAGTAVGRHTVDLAAPGCKIRSLTGSHLSDAESLSGTSQAAAFVSYAATLLSGNVAELNGPSIKNRLILTVDRSDEYSRLRSGGKLNIAKAVAANLDIIERNEGTIKVTLFGVIGELSNQIQLCGTRDTEWDVSSIGRIDLSELEGSKRKIEVVSPVGEGIYSGSCSVADRTISFQEYLSPGLLGQPKEIKLSDITQIIPMTRDEDRRWQRLNVPVSR
jgi:hypothetical protein